LGHKVAVLAVDPTSSLSKGSILGDKTRMEILSRDDKCFIRPSPSGGTLGGVTKKTRETTLLCEAAGYDVIIIETVGVGQSEITVRSMVDFFLLLKIAGAGDELQGIKRGIMELVDAIVINKADGKNIPMAEMAKSEFERAIHYLKPVTEKWIPQVLTCSAVESRNIDSIWDIITEFEKATKESGFFFSRRNKQLKDWLHAMIQEYLQNSFYRNPAVSEVINKIEIEIIKGEKPVTKAVQELIHIFNQSNAKDKGKNFK
ncbi:MAG: methylmalonyl Co-A mutase-associated GTPase MeaB, partial [Candidatus Cloacimonetes bacterium]|nr:methylmalonyl Co-A mutase-associated GTPase MeaB [Candidatus Cloacimonadota bacterium]